MSLVDPRSGPTLPSVPIPDDEARELSRAAKHAQTWLERRDRLIVEAVTAGAGLREVARLVGLTHPAIGKILRRNQTGNNDAAPDRKPGERV